jgi:AcrR family transcriptional regulator
MVSVNMRLTASIIHVSNNDMNTTYVSPLRQQYAAQTRTRILDAAIDGLKEGDLEGLTIAKVAADAGVTERTVYRHFKTREDLIKAVWPRMGARLGIPGLPQTVEALLAAPGRIYPRFDAEAGAVRASMYSQAGREIRATANPARHQAMTSLVAQARPELNETARRRRAAVIQMIGSSHGWACFKDYWGMDTQEAARAAQEAIAILLGVMPATADEFKAKEIAKDIEGATS